MRSNPVLSRIRALFLIPVLLLLAASPVLAAGGAVVDTYGLYDSSEISYLEQACADFASRTGIEAAILSVDADTVGGSWDRDTVRYAEDFGDSYLGENYILLIVNMDIRYYYIDVKGNDAFAVYTDSRQEDLGDVVVHYLSVGDYTGAARGFLETAEGQYQYAHQTGTFGTVQSAEEQGRTRNAGALGLSALVSAAGAGVATRVRAGRHHEKKLATDADRYVVPGTVNLHHNRDVFVSQYVTRMPRAPKNEGGGGGGGFTTVHTSGGGSMHSGHGGHF